jgi:hypothetical protein
MNDAITVSCEVLLTGMILYHLVTAFLSKDKSKIWSPITAISLTYTYYVLIPYWFGMIEKYKIDESLYNGYLFHFAALLSYVSIFIGFHTKSKNWFSSWNSLINEDNTGRYGLWIFIIGFIGYGTVRGFHLSFAIDNSFSSELQIGGFTYYFMMMLDMLPLASGLLLIRLKKNVWQWIYLIPFWFILVDLLIAGARWRIVVLLFVLLTAHHLYFNIKRINIPLMATLAIVVFLGFSAMDIVRSRGRGIDIEKVMSLQFGDIKDGPGENYSVYWFSVLCMDYMNKTGQYVYFEPVVTTLLMPIPRAIFPWKPDASYLKVLDEMFDSGGGAAYLNFVESYISFGWLGVVFWAWLLGWMARKFWDNYLSNRNSIAAIVSLGAFSGFCYVAISRGYLPATFTTFILAMCLPFWIIRLMKKIGGKNV